MARTLSANVGLAAAREASLGVLPGTPKWLTLQPNNIAKAGAELTTVTRQPMSKNRMEEAGEVVDLDSGFDYDSDLTMDAFLEFGEAFMMSKWTGPAWFNYQDNAVTGVTATGYTVGSGGALTAGWLIAAKGFLNVENNGLKVVTASIATEIRAAGLVVESVPADGSRNVSVAHCGVQGATGDITINAQLNLQSTVLDWTTLGWVPGQAIKIGGATAATQFATAADNGYAIIKSITATIVVLEWRSATFVADPGTGKTIQIFTGKWLRNVPTGHADSLMDRSYTFELAYEDLQAPGTDAYEYPKGNVANEITFGVPLTEKCTMGVSFVGTDTPVPTITRDPQAATARRPVQTKMFNTVSSITRLSLNETDETGLSTDFKTCEITLRNNVAGERVLANLGAKYVNFGIFQMMIDATVLFTDPDVVSAIRDHRTVSLKFGLKNGDGGFFMDVPAAKLESGAKTFPVNASVQLRCPIKPVVDPARGYVTSFTHFPYLP